MAAQNEICTLMITHNMKAALELGTRTVMMHEGRIVLDIQGAERDAMTVEGLIRKFSDKSGSGLYNDKMLLK